MGLATLGLLLLASTAAAQGNDGWKAANKAMGAALQAGDHATALRHSLEALEDYRASGQNSEKMLVSLALNVAELALQADKDFKKATSAIRSVNEALEAQGPQTAANRIYLYHALIELAEEEGRWDEVRGYLSSIVSLSRTAHGNDHPEVALALISYARRQQAFDATGPAANAVRDALEIAEKLPETNLNRYNILRVASLYHIEGRRYSTARELLQTVITRTSPDDAKQAPLWRLAMGNLAAVEARQNDRAKADEVIAKLIANTKENAEVVPLINWVPYDDTYHDIRQYSNGAKVAFEVGPNGHTTNVRIVETEGNAQFAASVIKAIETWRFLPIIKDGVPVKSATYTIRVGSEAEREAPTGSRLR